MLKKTQQLVLFRTVATSCFDSKLRGKNHYFIVSGLWMRRDRKLFKKSSNISRNMPIEWFEVHGEKTIKITTLDKFASAVNLA